MTNSTDRKSENWRRHLLDAWREVGFALRAGAGSIIGGLYAIALGLGAVAVALCVGVPVLAFCTAFILFFAGLKNLAERTDRSEERE